MLPLTDKQLTRLWKRRDEIQDLLEDPKTTQDQEMELYKELRDINGKLYKDHSGAVTSRRGLEMLVFIIIAIMGLIMIAVVISGQ